MSKTSVDNNKNGHRARRSPGDAFDRPKVELNEDDRLWRDQNVPRVSDDDFKKIKEVLDGNGNGNGKDNGEEEKADKKKLSKVDLALETAKHCIKKLFVDKYRNAHAVILVKDHLETLQLKSSRFRNYLASEVYTQSATVLDSQTLKDIIGILSAKAEFDSGDPIKLNLRIAQGISKSTWYYDLTNKNWEFVEITGNGWKVVKNQDANLVLFHRYSNQLAQVYPVAEYDANIFDRFIDLVLNDSNVKDKDKLDEYKILLKCYIVCSFIPDIPKAILMPHGSQGAAKTTLMELVKMVIDPSVIQTLSFPSDISEFIQQLSHNQVAFYDNISIIKDFQSDQICRAVSGSGSSKRVLYSDDDDFIRTLMRCIGLNGINLAATKPDLLDRSIFFELSRIPEDRRQYIKKVKQKFELMRPQILGYILDVLVRVMAWIEKNGMLELDRLPRMADWAGYCEIIARCMSLPVGKFIEAYKNNAKIQVEQVMETSEVAICLTYLMETELRFEGTATQLKKKLEDIAPLAGIDIKSNYFPKRPNHLVGMINMIKHTLKEAGIEIDYQTVNNKKIITISKSSYSSKASNLSYFDDNQAQENHAQTDIKYDEYDQYDGSGTIKVPQNQNPPKEKCPTCGEIDFPYYISRHKHD